MDIYKSDMFSLLKDPVNPLNENNAQISLDEKNINKNTTY